MKYCKSANSAYGSRCPDAVGVAIGAGEVVAAGAADLAEAAAGAEVTADAAGAAFDVDAGVVVAAVAAEVEDALAEVVATAAAGSDAVAARLQPTKPAASTAASPSDIFTNRKILWRGDINNMEGNLF